MASLNKVFLLGNLTRDPDLRALPSGSAVCEFGIAVNRRYMSSNGQEVEEPCFVDIVVWGRSAESCKQYLEKGSQVMIEGRLQLDQWEDRNGGYGQPRQAPQGGMPRAPQQPQGGMPRAPQPEMPPMPDNAFNPDEGMEDDIPF